MAIEPVTREERFLAAAGGRSVTPPAPITRKEQLLQGIIDAVKSGGATPDVIEGAVNDYLNANPVQPGATTEQVAQIEQNKTDIADLQTEVDELKESGGNGSGQNLNLTVEVISVGGESVSVTGLELDYTSASLAVGETMHLACSVIPDNASNTAITWESSDSGVAEIDNGLITAVSAGNAVITARSVENSVITAICAVTVEAAEGGGAGGQKIQLAGLAIVDGSQVKKDGSIVSIGDNAHYAEVPYSDGMEISTATNSGWSAYPPFVVKNTDGTYAVPEYTKGETAIPCGTNVWSYQCTTTLTGYTAETVFVNMQYKPGFDITSVDAFYYIPGGES